MGSQNCNSSTLKKQRRKKRRRRATSLWGNYVQSYVFTMKDGREDDKKRA